MCVYANMRRNATNLWVQFAKLWEFKIKMNMLARFAKMRNETVYQCVSRAEKSLHDGRGYLHLMHHDSFSTILSVRGSVSILSPQ